jgi:hypothetical protein
MATYMSLGTFYIESPLAKYEDITAVLKNNKEMKKIWTGYV